MTIEYKIKFEKDGVTITQRVDPGAGTGLRKVLGASRGASKVLSASGQMADWNVLGSSFEESKRLRQQRAA